MAVAELRPPSTPPSKPKAVQQPRRSSHGAAASSVKQPLHSHAAVPLSTHASPLTSCIPFGHQRQQNVAPTLASLFSQAVANTNTAGVSAGSGSGSGTAFISGVASKWPHPPALTVPQLR